MRGVERIGNFDGEIEDRVEIERTATDGMFQSQAVETLHDDIELAVGSPIS